MLIKQSITSHKLGSQHFWQIANSALNKGKSTIPPLLNSPEVLSSSSHKAKIVYIYTNFSTNSNLDDSGISLPVFPSRTNLILHNISVTPKVVKKVITNLDSSKVSSTQWWSLYLTGLVLLKLQHWHTGLLHKLKSYGIPGQIFPLFLLFSVINGFKFFWMGRLHKNIQLMLQFLKAPFLVLHFSYYILMTFLIILSIILLTMMMILFSTLSVIRYLICRNN